MNNEFFQAQLNQLMVQFEQMKRSALQKDLSDLPKHERQSLVTSTIAAVNRISGPNSTYSAEIRRILGVLPQLHSHMSSIMGIAQSLRNDLEFGYIQSLTEIIHSEIFGDFLEMAKHLVDKHYKDAAAVIAGSTLESHLKKLANKHGVLTEIDGKPVKADKINADLAKANIYNGLDQKNITSWLDLRNKAAHGQYDQYTIEQVQLLISSIQDFITRHPC